METRGGDDNFSVALFFAFKSLPMFISGMSIYLGYKLFVLGVTGKASIVLNATEISGQLINAAPGLFFAIGGVAALIVSVVKGVRLDRDGQRLKYSR